MNGGGYITLDGAPISGTTPYRVIDDGSALDRVAVGVSRAEDDDYTAMGAVIASARNGGDLDFKPDLNAQFGVRTLWNAGDGVYVHNDKVANTAWGHYIHSNTIVPLGAALRGAAQQSQSVGATGESLDQMFIRRGWNLR